MNNPVFPSSDSQAPMAPVAFDPHVAHNLVGTTLPDGWKLITKARSPGFNPDESGGNFSVGYIAEKDDKEAFVKVFDLGGVISRSSGNVMKALLSIGQTHQYECQILDICEAAKLDRVVKVISRGEVDIPNPQGYATPVPYIVFEKADCDVRKALVKASAIEDAWRLKMLHQVSVGLQQLHGKQIAHQDLKPSNVLVFDSKNDGAKIGDMGRASRADGTHAGHDAYLIAGDPDYAPPEQAYGVLAPEWRDRREGCDLYHLGALTGFVFVGVTPNMHYMRLPNEIRPPIWRGAWTGTYEQVLPHISAAFADYLSRIKGDLPSWGAAELTTMIGQMCDPEYQKRGSPDARAQVGSPLGLDRFISRFDHLSKIAQLKARTA